MYTGPKIITDNLILCLDAANIKSYTSGSTYWYDLSKTISGSTLINNPSFDSSVNGSLYFNGTDEYANCGNFSSQQITSGTILCWFKGQQQGNDYNGIVVKSGAWGIFIFQSKLYLYDWGNGVGRDTGVNVSDNTWRNVAFTFSSTELGLSNNSFVYINGNQVLNTTVKHSTHSSPLLVGYGNWLSQYFQGNISYLQIYNRVLTGVEIKQNYNSTKSRFSL
jgi:hypothetical protein